MRVAFTGLPAFPGIAGRVRLMRLQFLKSFYHSAVSTQDPKRLAAPVFLPSHWFKLVSQWARGLACGDVIAFFLSASRKISLIR